MKIFHTLFVTFVILILLGGCVSAACPNAKTTCQNKSCSTCAESPSSCSTCSTCSGDTLSKAPVTACKDKTVSASTSCKVAKPACDVAKVKACKEKTPVKACKVKATATVPPIKYNKCDYYCPNGGSCAPTVTTENVDVITNETGVVSYHPCRDNVCEIGASGERITLINYANATNPSYAQLLSFIESDQTDQISYGGDFVCSDYAALLKNTAESNGINMGWVGCSFTDNSKGHAYNIVNTTDQGIIFVDCSGTPDPDGISQDKILFAVEGQPLSGIYLSDGASTGSMGVIKSMTVFW